MWVLGFLTDLSGVTILESLRWKTFPHPKRAQSPEDGVQVATSAVTG